MPPKPKRKALKLKMFSGEPDPLFNYGDYKDVSLVGS
jgi:hypothetical protein